jgi:hypothetical protein
MLHALLHVLLPLVAALDGRNLRWHRFFCLLAGLVVDVDHLLATPIYDPLRCSLTSHPLHAPAAIAVYTLLCLVPRFRWLGYGLLLHMGLDGWTCVSLW